MYLNTQLIVFLMLATQHICVGLYIKNIKNTDETPAKGDVDSRTDEWGVFQNRLGLSHEKVELLKAQKDQLGTKRMLQRFIMENPKFSKVLTTNKKKPSSKLVFKRLFQALMKNFKASKSTLKTSLRFEVTDRPLKPVKRIRRKISVNVVSDLSTERVDQLLKMFSQKHNIERSNYDKDIPDLHADKDDIRDADIPQGTPIDSDVDSDYEYENVYDDEGDGGHFAKSHQNSEYGSFQDLILQAKRNQWERESEETKLHRPHNDYFI